MRPRGEDPLSMPIAVLMIAGSVLVFVVIAELSKVVWP